VPDTEADAHKLERVAGIANAKPEDQHRGVPAVRGRRGAAERRAVAVVQLQGPEVGADLMSVKIFQLCEAEIFCTKNASAHAIFNDGKESASRPLATCDEHKGLCQERADHHRVTVAFVPIAAQVTQ